MDQPEPGLQQTTKKNIIWHYCPLFLIDPFDHHAFWNYFAKKFSQKTLTVISFC